MKSTWVDHDGNVRCPKCGGKQFTSKRTGKAKWAGVLTIGVGVAAMPKRLKCQGCGENLKTGSARDSESREHEEPKFPKVDSASRQPAPESYREYINVDEVKMRVDEVEIGDLFRWANRVGVVEDIVRKKTGNVGVQLGDGKKPITFAPSSKVKVKRRH